MSDFAEIVQELRQLNATLEQIERDNSNAAKTLNEINDSLLEIKLNTELLFEEMKWWKEESTAGVMLKALEVIERKLSG